jgi:RNA polymerase sigma-70 factor, ECF subfamily
MEQRDLDAFHRGDRRVLEALYREHFDDVVRTARRYLAGADHENVVQQVFVKLLSSEEARRGFQGGSFGAWLHRVTQNQALEYLRKHRREAPAPELPELGGTVEPWTHFEAAQWVARFRRTLPPEWEPVFELCFLRRIDQRTAAAQLELARTTLAYRCVRIRWKLKEALLADEGLP